MKVWKFLQIFIYPRTYIYDLICGFIYVFEPGELYSLRIDLKKLASNVFIRIIFYLENY